MSVAEKLAELDGPNRTGLTALYRGGLVPRRVIDRYETYQVYQALRELPVFCDQPRRAMQQVARERNIDLVTVYRAVNEMMAPFAA